MVKNILNFNTRSYKDRLFVSPTEHELSNEVLSEYQYSIDLSSLDVFTAYLDSESIDFESLTDDGKTQVYSDFVLFELFDNKRFWGFYYPNYEIVLSDGKLTFSPYSFYNLEYNKLLRRHRIERHIAENVRVETELKGIRKALSYLIYKLGESDSSDVSDFIANQNYILDQIKKFPK